MRRHPLIWGVVLMLILAVGLAALVRLSGLVANPKSSLSFRPKVGVVSVEGIITDSIEVVEQLEECRERLGVAVVRRRGEEELVLEVRREEPHEPDRKSVV